MNNLKVAIIEDEVPAARLLHSILRRLRPAWEVMVLPGSVEEAVQWFAENPHPDLLFLDIQLSDGDSFSFLTSARPSSPNRVGDGTRARICPSCWRRRGGPRPRTRRAAAPRGRSSRRTRIHTSPQRRCRSRPPKSSMT